MNSITLDMGASLTKSVLSASLDVRWCFANYLISVISCWPVTGQERRVESPSDLEERRRVTRLFQLSADSGWAGKRKGRGRFQATSDLGLRYGRANALWRALIGDCVVNADSWWWWEKTRAVCSTTLFQSGGEWCGCEIREINHIRTSYCERLLDRTVIEPSSCIMA